MSECGVFDGVCLLQNAVCRCHKQGELPKRHGFVTKLWSLNQTCYRYVRIRRVDEKHVYEAWALGWTMGHWPIDHAS